MDVWTRFAALRAETATWSAQQAAESNVVVEGQLVHQRRISRRCLFYDLAEHDRLTSNDVNAQPSAQAAADRLEVILKIFDNGLSVDDVDAIRHGVNVGDVVRIHGFIEHCGDSPGASILLHARSITAVRAWKDVHPGVPFIPAPTIRNDTSSSAAPLTAEQRTRNSSSNSDSTQASALATAAKTSEAAAAGARAHCKFWINSRTCQYGDRCELVHAGDAELKRARAEWLQERLRLKRLRAKQDDDPLDAHGKSSKQQRAQVFVEWLETQFGLAFLSSGRGVVDVAGGRGSVSFELWNKRGVPCTLIDPRPMKLSKQQFKFMKKLRKDGDAARQALVPQRFDLFDTTTFLAKSENAALIAHASVLVGMHPDEATDAIVDVALQLNKPFVLVPCCVFGHKFPHRERPEGGRVASYEDLVAYLLAKHPSIEKAFLPFDGKNLVLFRRSGDGNATGRDDVQ